MGYMRDHAILVSSWDSKLIELARKAATEHGLGDLATNIVDGRVDGHRSFAIVPDGSKEGWTESDAADGQRAAFAAWLRKQAYDDGSTCLHWALVQFADDENESLVVDHDGVRTASENAK
jgi:hypothetical protein